MRTVTAPDGTAHTVRIEWIGNRLRRAPSDLRRRVRAVGRRLRRHTDDGAEAAEVAGGCLDLEALLVVLAVVVALALMVFVVAPALYGLIELLVVLLLAAGVWSLRVLFRRPWRVVHRGPGDDVTAECLVVGWRRAHAVMVAAASEVEATGAVVRAFRPGGEVFTVGP